MRWKVAGCLLIVLAIIVAVAVTGPDVDPVTAAWGYGIALVLLGAGLGVLSHVDAQERGEGR